MTVEKKYQCKPNIVYAFQITKEVLCNHSLLPRWVQHVDTSTFNGELYTLGRVVHVGDWMVCNEFLIEVYTDFEFKLRFTLVT